MDCDAVQCHNLAKWVLNRYYIVEIQVCTSHLGALSPMMDNELIPGEAASLISTEEFRHEAPLTCDFSLCWNRVHGTNFYGFWTGDMYLCSWDVDSYYRAAHSRMYAGCDAECRRRVLVPLWAVSLEYEIEDIE